METAQIPRDISLEKTNHESATITRVKIKNRYDENNSVSFFLTGTLSKDTDEIESWLNEKYPKNEYNFLYGRKFIRVAVLYIYVLYYKAQLAGWRHKLATTVKRYNSDFGLHSTFTNMLENWQQQYLDEKIRLHNIYKKMVRDGYKKSQIHEKFPFYLSVDPCELCFPWCDSGREENRMFFPLKLHDIERKNINSKELEL